MKNKEIAINKLKEAKELLSKLSFTSEDGEILKIKYINFEYLTEKQAKRRNIQNDTITLQTIEKYNNKLTTLTCYIIQEEAKK